MGVSEEKKREYRTRNFKIIMVKNLPKLMKDTKSTDPGRTNTNQTKLNQTRAQPKTHKTKNIPR